MPFENRFIIAQRGPTTYRFIGADLKTAKNKVQSKNVSAKVPTPAPVKAPAPAPAPAPRTRLDTGRGEGNDGRSNAPGMTPGEFARSSTMAELGNRVATGTFSGTSGLLDPTGLVGGMLGRAMQYAAYEGRQRDVDTRELNNRIDQRVTQERSRFSQASAPPPSTPAQEARTTKTQMTQATKAPTQNISTGAQRGGGGGGVEAGIRGPGGRGSESFGQLGRGSTGGGRGSGGFDNGGFGSQNDRDIGGFGGWT